ncbi:MAG: hypothetical protein PXY39_09920 [archaeon]|nr:hypothetical protein [archaeon]
MSWPKLTPCPVCKEIFYFATKAYDHIIENHPGYGRMNAIEYLANVDDESSIIVVAV